MLSISDQTIPSKYLEHIHLIRKKWEVTLNDLILAAFSLGCARLDASQIPESISFLNTVDLRRYLSKCENSVLNYSTARKIIKNLFGNSTNNEMHIPIISKVGVISFNQSEHTSPKIVNSYFLPCYSYPPTIFFAISTYQKQITITSAFFTPSIKREAVQRVLE